MDNAPLRSRVGARDNVEKMRARPNWSESTDETCKSATLYSLHVGVMSSRPEKSLGIHDVRMT